MALGLIDRKPRPYSDSTLMQFASNRIMNVDDGVAGNRVSCLSYLGTTFL